VAHGGRERQQGRTFPALSAGTAAVAFLAAASVAVAEEPARADPYSGDFLDRSTLTGDCGGSRNDLADKGVKFDANVVQTYQGVVDGGTNDAWEYGGRGDLTTSLDTGKLGLWQGGSFTVELEGNWGKAVNRYSGALSTVNSNQAFPVVGETLFAVPDVHYMQIFSPHVAWFVGKLDTIVTGDLNAFAHGKGDTQFMNLAFNINPVLVMTVPYSTLGTGIVFLPAEDPSAASVSLVVVSSVGEANTSGFGELSSNALTLTSEGRFRTDFVGKTGHQLFGFTYSNKEFTSLDQRLMFETGEIQKQKNSWSLFWNFDQYLYEPQKGSGQGVGVFGRLGTTDGNPNPVHFFASLGVGGKAPFGRPHDQFGVGWYSMDITSPKWTTVTGPHEPLRGEQGFELYYKIALTPWALLTPDVQIAHGARQATRDSVPVTTASVLGLRLELVF